MKTGLVQTLKPWSIIQRRIPLVAACLPMAFAVAACNQPAPITAAPAHTAVERIEGGSTVVGTGRISTYAEMEARGGPKAIGVSFSSAFMNAPPASHSDQRRCTDRNKDGVVDRPTECNMWHEWAVPLPSDMAGRPDVPFKWALINWNPVGHIPPGVYDLPHFDVHFYLEPIENVFAIEPGPCGPEFVRCDQFDLAKKSIPVNYIHSDYKDVDAVAPAMGNHLIDLTSPEFNGQRFTRSWIFGIYGGRITFYEEMLTRDYILSKPDRCHPIKTAAAVERAGYYPTVSCVRYDTARDTYNVSMEAFVLRERSDPGPPALLAPPPPPSPTR
jgi:hypothetical protein